MQFIDLKAQYEHLKQDIDSAVNNVLSHGQYINGKEVEKLEYELQNYVGTNHSICCANGTDALQLALMALNIGHGDAVFVPAFTFMATAEVVSLAGAVPIFVDIDYDTFNINCESLKTAVKNIKEEGRLNPKAVIPVDLFGQPADYNALSDIAHRYNLYIIEDGAQGFGGTVKGRQACSFGDISTTSFFPAKPLGCYGDGGAIFTDDKELCDVIMSMRSHGKGNHKYDHVRIGVNSRLDTIQAAILLVKLNAFTEYELEMRQKWADMYNHLLEDKVKTPYIKQGFSSSYAQYTVTLSDKIQRDALKDYLKEKGIPTMIYYPKALHLQEAYRCLGYEKGSLPFSELACECVLSLPMHPYLTKEIIQEVSYAISEFMK